MKLICKQSNCMAGTNEVVNTKGNIYPIQYIEKIDDYKVYHYQDDKGDWSWVTDKPYHGYDYDSSYKVYFDLDTNGQVMKAKRNIISKFKLYKFPKIRLN